MGTQQVRPINRRTVIRLVLMALVALVAQTDWGVAWQAQAAPQKSDKKVGSKRALLIGISKYPQTGTKPWRLLNAHQDVVKLKEALVAHGFAADDVLVLEDSDATKEGIRAAFRRHLIEPAKPGDTLFFHFSGHGQQVSDDNKDEIDGLDETLVPVESTDQHASVGAKTNLRDDELGEWLTELSGRLRGADGKQLGSVTVSLDSCFSGTATRGELVERGHGWDEALDGKPPPRLEVRSGSKPDDSVQETAAEVQFLSAALSTQTAKERNGMGVFTRALVEALKRASDQTTYRELLDDISYEVAQSGTRDQTPGLEGVGEAVLLSGKIRKRERTTRVVDVQGDKITLAAGQVHLVTVGSLYAVYRAGTDEPSEENKIGEAEVKSVSPSQSVLKLTLRAKLPKGLTARSELLRARVIETSHRYADHPLRVRFVGLSAELTQTLRTLSVLTEQGAGGDYDVEVRAEPNAIGLYRQEAQESFAKVAAGPDAVVQIESTLRSEWRWRSLMNLRVEDKAAQVTLRIVPVLCPLGQPPKGHQLQERTDVPKTEPLRLRAGDCFQLELRNRTYNKLSAMVLQLSSDGSIEPSYPHPRQPMGEVIEPRKTVRIPAPYWFKVELDAGRRYERSVFKVIATSEPVDLSPLLQRAYEASRAPAQNRGPALDELDKARSGVPSKFESLVRLLSDTALGEQNRSMLPTSLDAWGVTTSYLDQEAKP
jgi:hypothetical protein